MQMEKTLAAMQIVPDYVTVAAIPPVQEVALEIVLVIAEQVAEMVALVFVQIIAKGHVEQNVGPVVAAMPVKQPAIYRALVKRW